MLKILILLIISFTTQANDFLHFFNKTTSFSADFTQEVGGEQTSGVLSFARPKSLKWHTTSPEESIIILHNNIITKYDVWIQSANIIPYTHNELIEYLTTSPEALTQAPSFVATQEGVRYYQLGDIYFGFTSKVLSDIIITNQLEQKIYVSLTNVVLNKSVEDDFVIKFPRDVDILDETR